MQKKQQKKPASVESLVRQYLVDNPGEHRPTDIVKGIGDDRATLKRVARSLFDLSVRGLVKRVAYEMPTKKGTMLVRGRYAATDKTPVRKPANAK